MSSYAFKIGSKPQNISSYVDKRQYRDIFNFLEYTEEIDIYINIYIAITTE